MRKGFQIFHNHIITPITPTNLKRYHSTTIIKFQNLDFRGKSQRMH